MKKESLLELGFTELPHKVVDFLVYELGRQRQLSIGALGTPNEVMFISEVDPDDPRVITDTVCLHNYDYDGYLTLNKVFNLISIIKG